MALKQFKGVGVFAASLLMLTACGGGGSSGNAANNNNVGNTGNTGGSTTNSAPVAMNGNATLTEDGSKAITLSGSDADGNALTYVKVANPAHGSLSISGNVATYTPVGNYNGTDSFTYKVSDGALESGIATVNLTINAVNDAPVAESFAETSISGQSKSFDLRGSDVDDTSATRTARIVVQPQHGSLTLNGMRVSYTANGSYTGSDIFSYTLSDGKAVSNTAQVTLSVTSSPVTSASKLNDTGVTLCGDYAYDAANKPIAGHPANSDLSCGLLTDANGDAIPAGQDATNGRDFTHNDDSDGHAGFSFTKISSTGQVLANNAATWACVKDNVTGLVWEVKTDDDGLHDKDWKYTWYNTDMTKNGGQAGIQDGGICQGSQCDTQGYVQAVNTAGWCGAKDWRMPTVKELQSIADHSMHDPAIDANYFPNTVPWVYWSGTSYVDPAYAWFVGFNGGNDNWGVQRGYEGYVRLVRSSP